MGTNITLSYVVIEDPEDCIVAVEWRPGRHPIQDVKVRFPRAGAAEVSWTCADLATEAIEFAPGDRLSVGLDSEYGAILAQFDQNRVIVGCASELRREDSRPTEVCR